MTLARARLRAGELGQACVDGQQAIQMATAVTESKRVRTHLRQLMNDAAQYQREPAVRDLREELRAAVAGVRDDSVLVAAPPRTPARDQRAADAGG